ncbi:MAG: YceH family protein [Mariprofundaceae bacterium]|nr:YceH family protein [Mariprofundaceae bacterium]
MLTAHEARVLGCLMEKQMTTPDYYPLTLNSLVTACNQKSSRVPVMSLSPGQVGGVVNSLRGRGLVTARMDGRADKFEQHLSRKLALSTKERAIICVLMLRRALTLNEIRINTGRMVSFDETDELQGMIQGLMERDVPIVVKLPRASGQREERFTHLLCGKPNIETAVNGTGYSNGGDRTAAGSEQSNRIARLEREIDGLKKDVTRLLEFAGLKQGE